MAPRRLSLSGSSVIAGATYDEDEKLLSVSFTSGKSYELANVPPAVATSFEAAGSPGQFWNQQLKGRY